MVVMRLLGVVVAGLVLAGCTGVRVPAVRTEIASAFAESGEVEIGVIEDGWAVVEATINGQGPYRLLLDTGSDLSILSHELLDVIQPRAHARGTFGDIHGLMATHEVYLADSIEIKGVELDDAPLVFTSNLDAALKNTGTDGVLGYHGLDQFTLDLDGDSGVVRLSTRRLKRDAPGVMKMVARDGGTPVVRLTHRLGDGRVLDKLYGLDSGGGFYVSIAGAASDRFIHSDRVRVAGGAAALNSVSNKSQFAPLNGSFWIGSADADWTEVHTVSGVPVAIDNQFSLIGNRLLSLFRVQIDPVSRLVRFTRGGSSGGAIRGAEMYGIGVLDAFWIEDRLIIRRIGDQSPAMRAGLRPGDAVIEIDGDSVDRSEVRQRLGFVWEEERTMKLLVAADGAERVVEVGMERLFADDLGERGPDLELPTLDLEGGVFVPDP